MINGDVMLRDVSLYKKKVVVLTALVFIAALMGLLPVQKELRQVVLVTTPTAAVTMLTVTPRLVSSPTAVAALLTATATITPFTPSPTPSPVTSAPTPTPGITVVPSTPTPAPTPTPVPPSPTPTPTRVPPSPTPTATTTVEVPAPTSTVPAVPANPSQSEELAVPDIVTPRDGLETSEGKVVIEGTAPAGAVVVVYDGDRPLGVTRADEDGKWRLEPKEPLAEGRHVITARTTDGQLVSRPSAAVGVVVLGERLPVTGGGR